MRSKRERRMNRTQSKGEGRNNTLIKVAVGGTEDIDWTGRRKIIMWSTTSELRPKCSIQNEQ